MTIDLHCHSNHSDGELSPTELIALAQRNGATMISITDHDTVSAYEDLPTTFELRLLPGVEFSCLWRNTNVHIVGLGIDPTDKNLRVSCSIQSEHRMTRARIIADRLFSKRVVPSAEAALMAVSEIAGTRAIGRPDFADHLVQTGVCEDRASAFKSYLGAGKVGDVKEQWPDMKEVIKWIGDSGGVAVLAHPAKYKMTRSKLISMIREFREYGGESIEVCAGHQTDQVTKSIADLSKSFDLSASCGSDFHSLDRQWSQVGKVRTLPSNCRPVWEKWI